ncbi:DUF6221 family protein [Streptomyces microflavus]|uniref:DUF6221 family protein n=1 Tax=Streptomyces microflavus TaxID=1919 RepID=UPI003B225D49
MDTAITAREEAAYAAPRSPWTIRVDDDEIVAPDGITVAEAFALSGQQTRAILELIALHQPASVLRRCAADRKLIAEHGPCSDQDLGCKGCGFNNQEESMVDHYEDCPVLCGIAEGYGRTEGER